MATPTYFLHPLQNTVFCVTINIEIAYAKSRNENREFFRVSLDEIEAVVRANHDKTVEFTKVPEAEQFRISAKISKASS